MFDPRGGMEEALQEKGQVEWWTFARTAIVNKLRLTLEVVHMVLLFLTDALIDLQRDGAKEK